MHPSFLQPDPAQGAKSSFAYKRFVAVAAVCIAAVGGLFAFVLVGSYRAAEDLALQTSRSIGMLVEQDLTRNIDLLDLSLQAVVEGVANPKIMALEPSLRQQTLFDQSAAAAGIGSILVLNEKGDIILDSRTAIPPKANLADRDYFQVHRASPTVGLYLSRPFQSRIRGSDWTIGISRRLSHSDGSFAGVVVAGISLGYFQGVLQKINLGKNASIMLLNNDGDFLARSPFVASLIGQKDFVSKQVRDRLPSASNGALELTALDNVHRLYCFHRIKGLPIAISIGMSTDEIFGDWRRRAVVTSLGVFVLSTLIFFLILRIVQELRLREQLESRLAMLATTDVLTGLANRRRFDEYLKVECLRARRDGTTLSMLMIDVDLFKAYNDEFGHQIGDQVLSAIADAIKLAIKRPADLVARYGGEEFAVLLPDTDKAAARLIAERIRQGVEALKLDLIARRGKVTVSIGVAEAFFEVTDDETNLVREADRAMYRAKTLGRNRVYCGDKKIQLVSTTKPAFSA